MHVTVFSNEEPFLLVQLHTKGSHNILCFSICGSTVSSVSAVWCLVPLQLCIPHFKNSVMAQFWLLHITEMDDNSEDCDRTDPLCFFMDINPSSLEASLDSTTCSHSSHWAFENKCSNNSFLSSLSTWSPIRMKASQSMMKTLMLTMLLLILLLWVNVIHTGWMASLNYNVKPFCQHVWKWYKMNFWWGRHFDRLPFHMKQLSWTVMLAHLWVCSQN
jgi:hypothetical protein